MPKKQSKRILVPRTHNAETWTKAMYFSQIRSALRKAFMYWKPIQLALKNASRPSKSKNKRLKTEYKCAKCKGWFPRTGVHVDHKIEAGSLNCFEDIVPFIKRLTEEDIKQYQILCEPCHKIKTQKYIKDGKV